MKRLYRVKIFGLSAEWQKRFQNERKQAYHCSVDLYEQNAKNSFELY